MRPMTFLFCSALCVQPMMALAEDSPANTSNSGQKSPSGTAWTRADTSYALETLHETDLHEMAAGQLAKERGTTPAIMDFGATLHEDHQAAEAKIQTMAKGRKLVLMDHLPSGTDSAKAMQGLRKLTGTAFDHQFIKMMEEGHDKAITMVKKWQKDTDDQKLRALLDELLPKLESHRETAHKLAKK